MGEFDDFAADLGRQHDEKQNAFDAARRRQQQDREHSEHFGRVQLEGSVMPILEDARRAFARQGIRVAIETTWDKPTGFGPGISFQVFGQKRRAFDVSEYEVAGDIAGIMHDGKSLSVTLAPNRHNPFPGRTHVGSDLAAVREVVKRALASVYELLDPKKE